jgi:hypothetical protein
LIEYYRVTSELEQFITHPRGSDFPI